MALSSGARNSLGVALADRGAGVEVAAVLDGAAASLPQALAAASTPTFAALTLTGNAIVGGTSAVTGNATFAGTLGVTGNATVGGNATVTGDVVAGATKGLKVGANYVVKAQQTAIADLAVTFTAGDPSITPNSAVTISNGTTPTVAELQEFCVELKAKLNAALAALRAHGLIAT